MALPSDCRVNDNAPRGPLTARALLANTRDTTPRGADNSRQLTMGGWNE